MNERSTFIIILMALYLGSRISADLGASAFHLLLGVGWAGALTWTLIAWRRGEKVFIWQNRDS